MEDFLASYFSYQDFQLQKLSGDGGHRSYTRVKTKAGDSYILMSSGEEDPSLKDFVVIHKKLNQATCFVPKIFKTDFSKGFLLMEDLGDEMLEDLQGNKKTQESYYLKSIEQLIKLQQKIKPVPEDQVFDKKFFQEEIDTAIHRLEEFLKTLQQKSFLEKTKLKESLKEEMEKVISQFVKTSFVYCHRDFHSKNIMISKGEPYLLDFQDAGAGPWMYDLTSLIYDSYVPFTDLERQNFIKFYFENSELNFKKSIGQLSDLNDFVQLQFLQRGFKACGCFAGFYNSHQQGTHLRYIKPTLQNLYEVATVRGYKNMASYFKELKNQLNLKSFDEISVNKSYSFLK